MNKFIFATATTWKRPCTRCGRGSLCGKFCHSQKGKVMNIMKTAMSLSLAITVLCGCDSTNLRKITVAQYGDVFIYLPMYVASEFGFFKKEGLDVRFVTTGGDDKTFAAVASGSAQFGIADPVFAAIAKEKGLDGVVIGTIVNGVPFSGVTIKEEIKPITSPSQLQGFRVATFPAPSTAYAIQKEMFLSAGLKPSIVEVTIGAGMAALHAGRADIALELEPNVSDAVSRGNKVVYSLAEFYGDFAFTGITSTDSFIRDNPELTVRFLRAVNSAMEFIHTNRIAVVDFAETRYNSFSRNAIRMALDRVIEEGVIPKTVRISKDGWRKALRLRVSMGELKNEESGSAILRDLL